MRVALFHGWELTGSGSNEYTRYLARALARAGHEVHVACREEEPAAIDFVSAAHAWDAEGRGRLLFDRDVRLRGRCTLHILPHGPVRPVFVTDKQRAGNVKTFSSMTDAEVAAYRTATARALHAALRAHPVDVLHANHMVLQPTVAADVCGELRIPFVIYPHGSAIEYTVKTDPRFRRLAGEAVDRAGRLIIGSEEVRRRLLTLYPERREAILAKSEVIGVGVDTSLFEPVTRAGRAAAIERLRAARPGGGKTAALTAELHRRLDAGELEAVRAYRDAYSHGSPDEGVADELARIDWDNARVVLFVGALTVGKGLQSVVAGLPRVLARVPRGELVVVGAGAYREVLEGLVHAVATGNGALLDALTRRGNDLDEMHLTGPWADVKAYLADPAARAATLAAGSRFADHVHFLGRLDHGLLRHLFPCADLAVFPSIIPEAYPLVLVEALANGVLPLASDFSGFAEALDQLVPDLGRERVESMRLPVEPAVRVRGIADRLASLLVEPRDWGARLRTIATSRYDWKIRARAMVEAYRRCI